MLNKWLLLSVVLCSAICIGRGRAAVESENGTKISRGFLGHNGFTGTLHHILNHCLSVNTALHCFKLQGARLLGRALKFQNINIIEGVSLVKRLDDNENDNENETRTARTAKSEYINLTNRDLDNLSTKSLDSVLSERFYTFLQSRQIQVNMPRLLALGHRNFQWIIHNIMNLYNGLDVEEGRKKDKDKGGEYLGPFIAAVMLKAAIMKMAYHSIAIVAGKALIVGKIALIISAIIGLKKLVSSESSEKTTYEIVKHPQISSSHSYSSSHFGDYDGGHESGGGGGSYHRSIGDEMMIQEKAYSGWMPTPSNS